MTHQENLRLYSDLISAEVPEVLEFSPLILPMGSVEQHGPHLPLSVDIDIATAIAREIACRCQGILAPGITYAARSLPFCGGGSGFPGTIFTRGAVLIEYLNDVLAAYINAGARKIVIINGHYENESLLFESLDQCRENGHLNCVRLLALSWWNSVENEFIDQLLKGGFPGWHAEHAGITETSLMMFLRPELVREVRVDNPHPPRAGLYFNPTKPDHISNQGVLSQSTGSSAEIGRTLFLHVCEQLERMVGQIVLIEEDTSA